MLTLAISWTVGHLLFGINLFSLLHILRHFHHVWLAQLFRRFRTTKFTENFIHHHSHQHTILHICRILFPLVLMDTHNLQVDLVLIICILMMVFLWLNRLVYIYINLSPELFRVNIYQKPLWGWWGLHGAGETKQQMWCRFEQMVQKCIKVRWSGATAAHWLGLF